MERKIYYYLDEVNRMRNGDYVNPVSCEIDPSNRCMLNCEFCMYKDYRKENAVDLELPVYEKLIHELKEIGVESITFTGGGEPLMNLNFNEMAKMAFDLGFQVGLITNGVLLNTINDIEKFTFIRISLDAGTSETYYKIKKVDRFNLVLNNIKEAVSKKATVGLSFVICEENKKEIRLAQHLAAELEVEYIQFKPAWVNGNSYRIFDSEEEITRKTIVTQRYMAKNNLPCIIAGLVGIVGADSNLYFCCQYRGNEKFKLGSLKKNSFEELWGKRLGIFPDVSKCPQCRYMNYAKAYSDLIEEKSLFFDHRYFL